MMKFLRSSAVALLGLILVAVFSFQASADSGHRDYEYHIGDHFGGVVHGPDVAESPNGDTVAIEGSGTLSIHPKEVTGEGTFVHKNANGDVLVSGTWKAEQLLSFHSYGNGVPQGTPPEFEGGLALIRVHLSAGLDAIMQVDCLLGKPPAGANEGVRLNVQGGLNFNKEVSGETLYVRLP